MLFVGYQKLRGSGFNNEPAETMLNLFITLEPPLVQPTFVKPRVESDETLEVRKRCHIWKRLVIPKREANVFLLLKLAFSRQL